MLSGPMKSRLQQATLIGSFSLFSWLMMQIVHELGHVSAAIATGGRIRRVVLHPLRLSRTDVEPNPHPLVEVWAGPAVGTAVPVTVWLLAKAMRGPGLLLYRFFAGFCCIANGVYIAFGSKSGGMDTAVMLNHGCHRWQLVLFGIPVTLVGLWLWDGTGRAFGFGEPSGSVDRRLTFVSLGLLLGTIAVELIVQ